ncbi:Kelch motif/Galactose oxidase [Trypanosoma brucei equiperdum]|uniref:Kelch motif/Galactose oxidase n=1 Tax=Trypanosoma brucei equiperdum TaxID=630700 RepID=A0A3L6LE97_9TRYP|nr:Kelch motif/Galactose oxidase [Trypanosoma brucei equiperdum]
MEGERGRNSQNQKLGLELVHDDGRPIASCPIDMNELLKKMGKTVEVKEGVRVRLEEYNEDEGLYYSEDSWSEESEEESQSEENDSAEDIAETPPPGCRRVEDWNSAVRATQRGEKPPMVQASGILSRSPKHIKEKGTADIKAGQIPRRELWVSRAPPADTERTYKRLQTVRLMPCPTSRRFCLPPLTFHAAASYTGNAARGPRMLVYGGTTNLGKTTENELYEFSLLSGDWRRVEGKQSHSPGVYGHTAVVLKKHRRVVLTGGVGYGGVPPEPLESLTDDYRRARFHLLFPHKEPIQSNAQAIPETVANTELPTLWTLAHAAESVPTFGFLPVIFDVDLRTRRWRTIETSPKLPVVFHSAVAIGTRLYIFGGMNTHLQVSSQLILVDGETYKISLIPPSTDPPKARFLHSAVVYAHWMIIYGGFDAHNQPLDDAWAFDTVNERWEQLHCHGSHARGAHAACVVGSRLIVVGGFDSSFDGDEAPASTCLELNLIPNHEDKHLWRPLPLHPTVPPVAFAAVCPCGDDASFLLYGGCIAAKKGDDSKKAQGGGGKSPGRGRHTNSGHTGYSDCIGDGGDNLTIWKRLVPSNEGFLLTFPVKRPEKNNEGDGEPRYNALGVEIDPDEVPAEFLAFVKRQHDFLLKKTGNVEQTMKKIFLEERESMEPHLYLTPDEVERLIEESEELCTRFSEYKMEELPPHVPERQLRLHLNEECVSLSRQVRDVIKSMKGNPAAAAAVKSKTHRFKVGQKFESHSAPKPFRRVVIMSLMKEIKRNIKRVLLSNKALKTVEWPNKAEYLEAIRRMQETADTFLLSVKEILDVYIEKRVDSLVSAIDTRKNKLKRLTEAVERSRQSFPVHPLDIVARVGGRGGRSSPSPQSISSRARSRSPSARHFKGGEEATHTLNKGEVGVLLNKASAVRTNASLFGESCQSMIPPAPKQVATALLVPGMTPPPEGEDAAASRETVWHTACGQVQQIVKCVDRFIEGIRASQLEQKPLNEAGDGTEEGSYRVNLALATVWPLETCKDKLDELKKGMPEVHNSSPAAGGDEAAKLKKTQQHYTRLSKSLTALVQSVKMSILSRAGAKPPPAVHITSRDVVAASPSSKGRAWRPPQSRRQRSTIEVLDLHADDATEPEGYSPTAEEEQRHCHAVLSPLSPKLVPIEDLFASPRTAPAVEAPNRIPITSREAAALVSAPQAAAAATGECVIVPSKKDVRVVKNSSSASLLFHEGDDTSAAMHSRLFPPQAYHDYYAAAATPQQPTCIAVSNGPKMVAAGENRSSDAVISLIDVFDGVHPVTVTDEGKQDLKAMVSVTPGFFHAHPSAVDTGTSETSDHVKYCDSPMLEDDYFFFGRRLESSCLPTGPAQPLSTPSAKGTTRKKTQKREPSVKLAAKSRTRDTKSSPHCLSFSATPLRDSKRRSVSRGERAVRQLMEPDSFARGGGGGPLRGKLTPGEARIAEARKRGSLMSGS